MGQVHRATLHDGRDVMVKVQYPGVADSIQSDLRNLKLITQYAGILPKGLFMDNILKVAGRELAEECDYKAEAKHMQRMAALVNTFNEHFGMRPSLRGTSAPSLRVPKLVSELSTSRIITSELVPGHPIDNVKDNPNTDPESNLETVTIAVPWPSDRQCPGSNVKE